jgi:hypothetical protein
MDRCAATLRVAALRALRRRTPCAGENSRDRTEVRRAREGLTEFRTPQQRAPCVLRKCCVRRRARRARCAPRALATSTPRARPRRRVRCLSVARSR